jgi:hypothetical protein
MKRGSRPRNYQLYVNFSALIISVYFLLSVLCPADLKAKPVSSEQAQKAVKGWLKLDPAPLKTQLGNQIKRADVFTDNGGEPIYYVIYLRPSGFVITPADDMVEPIIAFADDGIYDPSPDNPLGAMVSRDLPGRIAAARDFQALPYGSQQKTKLTGQQAALEETCLRAQDKWAELNDYSEMVGVQGIGSISDVWVAPLLLSKWSQSTECGYACYNYYTPGASYPPITPNVTSNYVCGCVATAMAQYMRYWQYPTTGVGPGQCFTIRVDSVEYTECLRGGNGSGGPYNWSDMVLDPGCSTTATQREAIGALTFDAGVAAHMSYASGGSGAGMFNAGDALQTTFLYSNAIVGYDFSEDGFDYDVQNNMINTNLDSGNPVLLGIYSNTIYVGHAIVADGYGYNAATLYHHLNLGWGGSYDAWYNLPNIGTPYNFDVVDACIYNIYISGSGEIISGRVTDTSGNPVSGATVTGIRTGGGTYNDTTDSKGIYALAKIPSSSEYTVSVTKTNYFFTNQIVWTGESTEDPPSWPCGNQWGIDFVGATGPMPPTAEPSIISVHQGVGIAIDLHATDEGLPNPPGVLSYIITTLPSHGTLNDPGAGDITAVPYTLAGNGNQVVYTSTIGYGGTDNFTFKANDGGVPPSGGDSNIATVSINVTDAIYFANMDTNPGWTLDSLWQWGVPTGGGGQYGNPDPTAGHTGSNVVGYNLSGDYENSITSTRWAKTPAINCSNRMNVTLTFYRWLNVESPTFDHAYIQVSNNGSSWSTIWENIATSAITDSSWTQQTFDISAFADNQPTVYIRWGMGPTDSSWQYSGWNIDDVEITGDSLLPQPPVAQPGSTSTQNDTPVPITLLATDDGLPNGVLNYIITTLPSHGKLQDPLTSTIIRSIPYTLTSNGNQVVYIPCVAYTGPDSFDFKANDGGTPPTGGDSGIATVAINVQPPAPITLYETGFNGGLPSGWTIVDGLSDGYTWTTTNYYLELVAEWTGKTYMVVGYEYTSANMDEQLVTHSIDCTGLEDVKLSFKHILKHYSTEVADVDIRVNGGPWQNLQRYNTTGEYTITGVVEKDLSSVADGQSNVQIRWRYYNADWEWYWGIDDVEITATASAQPTPGDFEPDCDVDLDDFAVFASAWLSSLGSENWNPDCDISDPSDNIIDELDLEVFTENWLAGL